MLVVLCTGETFWCGYYRRHGFVSGGVVIVLVWIVWDGHVSVFLLWSLAICSRRTP